MSSPDGLLSLTKSPKSDEEYENQLIKGDINIPQV